MLIIIKANVIYCITYCVYVIFYITLQPKVSK